MVIREMTCIALKGLCWQAHLHVNNVPACGATIIDEETVLTTAFCVIKSFSNQELLDKTSLEIEAGVVSHGDAAAQIKGISEIIVHPCHRKEEVTIDRYVPYSCDQNHVLFFRKPSLWGC